METQLADTAATSEDLVGRDFYGTAIVRGPGWRARWYRVLPSSERKVAQRQRWISALSLLVPAVATPLLGGTGLVAGVAVAAGISYAAMRWLVHDLEEVPAARVPQIAKPRLQVPWVRTNSLYWGAVGYMSALSAASIYFGLTGDPLFGIAGAVICGGCIVMLIRERRKADSGARG